MNRPGEYSADVLFIGATHWTAGAVHALHRRGVTCAVLEGGQICGAEFGDALYTDGNDWTYKPQSEAGAAFRQELIDRGILSDRGISLPALCPVISHRLLDDQTLLLAAAHAESISSGDGYLVTFRSMGYRHTLTCRMIIDTTAEFSASLFFGAERPHCKAMLSANLIGSFPGSIPGNRKGECYIRMSVQDGEYGLALRDLLEKVRTVPDVKAGIVPLTPVVLPDEAGRTLSDTLRWIPSVSCGNPVAAYGAGVLFGRAFEFGHDYVPACDPTTVKTGSYDVIVCGGGTAGAIAALAAAKMGGSVLLLEATTALGGMGTAGGVLGYYFGVPGGLYTEVDKRAKEIARELPAAITGGHGDLSKRLALAEMLREAGVAVLYRAVCLSVLKDSSRVTGVRYSKDGQLFESEASFVIDATAEGCMLISAGAGMQFGRVGDGRYQPYSNVLAVADDDTGRAHYTYTDNGSVDQYDPAAFGRAILYSACDVNHLRECYASGARYLAMPGLLGLREGQRIIGEENVSIEKLLMGQVTDHPAFWGYSNFDNHGKDNALESPVCRLWNTAASMWGYNLTIPIPAGALIPRGLDGILAAGRCLAVDHMTASAVRMKYDMQKSGETAGTLAMLAIRRSCRAAEVPYKALKPLLNSTDCLNDGTRPEVVRICKNREAQTVSEQTFWRKDAAWLKNAMTGELDSYAVWSVAVNGDKLHDALIQWLESTDRKLRYGAAAALGIAGCRGCDYAPATGVLMKMAADKSGETPVSGRKYNYPYALSAVTLLDLLGVGEALPVILPLVADRGYTDDIPFTPCELFEDREDLHFQYFLNGFAALCGFYRSFPALRDTIRQVMDARLDDPAFLLSVTGKSSKTVRIDYTALVRERWAAVTHDTQQR